MIMLARNKNKQRINPEATCIFLLIGLVLSTAFSHADATWGRPALHRHKDKILQQLRAGSNEDENDSGESDVFRPVILEADDEADGGVGDDIPRTLSSENVVPKVLIVMDGFCPYLGVYMMRQAQQSPGVIVVPVLSEYLRNFLLLTEPEKTEQWQALRIPTSAEQAREWISHLPSEAIIAAVYCESDSGLEEAELLRQRLNVTQQDTPAYLPARRDKYLMNEMVQKSGLATAQQKMCHSASEARDFAQELLSRHSKQQTPRVVVKPFRGVASESVHLCETIEQVQEAWDVITDTTVFGVMSADKHNTVLVQEFLEGDEYVLDVVSRNGEHKIAAVWKYDKRPVGRAPFCYFQTKLVDAAMEPVDVPIIQEYTRKVLNALGVQYGLTHNEVIVTADRGPVLVEVNCRQHNMDFAPITMACIGYNALDMTLDALLGRGDLADDDWELYPSEPTLRAYGCMVHLVNYESGILQGVNHLDDMSDLPSFFKGQVYDNFQAEGESIEPTVDIRSDAGWVQLLNQDLQELERDFRQIVDWMPSMFNVE
mmetsp:Transcript_23534/g.48859  ORF Transcript_23534/g.48859 Transcript_23534/m.48859 type:complete len:542 (-) Transcript_23534:29-1654(-)